MKGNYRRLLLMVAAFIGIVILIIIPEHAQTKIVTNVEPDIAADQLKAIVVEDFENAADEGKWKLQSEPRKLEGVKNPEDNPVSILEIKFIDGAPADMIPEKWASNNKGLTAKKCLGIHFQFKYPGANSVHVVPIEPVKLPGRSHGMSLWVHGRGHDYSLECWVEDYKGSVHILKFGSVNYVGWRPLKAKVPVSIPQSIDSYPQTRFLQIKRFVIRAQADAGLDEVFLFLDQIKVLTDDYEVNFDGQDLHKAFKSGEKSEKTVK